MNKTLHVFVYLFLILAGAGLFFEFQLNEKRKLLTDRNRIQEEYITKIAGTVECVGPENKDAVAEINKDISPVEAKEVDVPSMDNILQDYRLYLEQGNLKTYEWINNDDIIKQLRMVYVLDAEGRVVMDGDRAKDSGPGTERELLEKLLKSCQEQQSALNTTRSELKNLRGKLSDVVEELNALKQEDRRDKVTIVEKEAQIATLESEKADLQNQIAKAKAQIDELTAEVSSLKDDLATSQAETEAAKEDYEKMKKQYEDIKKALKELQQSQSSLTRADTSAVSSIPFGDKGRVILVDNENMFAVVEFTPEAMKQLKGEDKNRSLPIIDLGVKRPGFQGEAGEFVGRIRLRQEVEGRNFITCDILPDWEQSKLQINDVVFSD